VPLTKCTLAPALTFVTTFCPQNVFEEFVLKNVLTHFRQGQSTSGKACVILISGTGYNCWSHKSKCRSGMFYSFRISFPLSCAIKIQFFQDTGRMEPTVGLHWPVLASWQYPKASWQVWRETFDVVRFVSFQSSVRFLNHVSFVKFDLTAIKQWKPLAPASYT
jgi:hypothetical protein